MEMKSTFATSIARAVKLRCINERYAALPGFLKAYVDRRCPNSRVKDDAWLDRRLDAIETALTIVRWSLLLVSSIIAGSIAYVVAAFLN